jgi:hypothetical protein
MHPSIVILIRSYGVFEAVDGVMRGAAQDPTFGSWGGDSRIVPRLTNLPVDEPK